jgi:signal peptidase I
MAKDFKKSTVREYFESIVIAVILALFVRTFVLQAFKIPTGSMENNLLIGDHLLVNKFMFAPTDSAIERLPGETLELKEKKIYINGTPLDEPYVHFLEEPHHSAELSEVTSSDVRENYGPVTVPPNQYFMMGDNRDNSADSRYWGFMPRDYVKGKALLIYWSYEAEREDYEDESTGATIKGLGSVFMHFFTKTRWDRLGHFIR